MERNLHLKLGFYTGLTGCFSIFSTVRFLRKVNQIVPDLIHLHNLHNGYINLGMLFRYIKRKNIPVVWTLHDCWAFTGQCAHFTMVRCDKWKNGCFQCKQYKEYPATKVDNTKKMYRLKRKWFTGVSNLTVITPSKWLADLVKQSFLREYPVQVIYNGIDLDVFQPTSGNFREKYGIESKKIVLGVADGWSKRKGLDDFIKLAERLDESYAVVLVGLSVEQQKELPSNIIGLRRTKGVQELAEIYGAADVLFNPSIEETFGLVTAEAMACGTPVVVYNATASPELVEETECFCVEVNAIKEAADAIVHVCVRGKKTYSENCINKVKEHYNRTNQIEKYIECYIASIKKS